MTTRTIKPGILVSLRTVLRGGVSYRHDALAADEVEAPREGAQVARWETTRIIDDPDEFERGKKARTAAGTAIRRMCIATDFGLLCPQDKEADLDAAIADAQKVAAEFNAGASISSVSVYTIKGRIAETDEQAARAIASEVRGLLEEMQAGIRSMDVKAVRAAADRARALRGMLDDTQSTRVNNAVEAARAAAREIVRRVDKGGEDAAVVLLELATAPIESARFAFLDTEDQAPIVNDVPGVEVQRFAEVDFEPDSETNPAAVVPDEDPVVLEMQDANDSAQEAAGAL